MCWVRKGSTSCITPAIVFVIMMNEADTITRSIVRKIARIIIKKEYILMQIGVTLINGR